MNLKIVAYISIISAILILLEDILKITKISSGNKILLLIPAIMQLLLFLFILLGYRRLAKENILKFLEVMVYISIIFIILAGVIVSVVSLNKSEEIGVITLLFLALPIGILEAVANILLGISLFKLKSVFGEIIIAIAITYIISMGLNFIPFVSMAGPILEAILFFKAAKIYPVKESVNNQPIPKNI